MKIDELEKKSEINQEEFNRFAEQIFFAKAKTYIRQIREYIDRKYISISEAVDEVNNKTSGLTSRARQVLSTVPIELLEKWFPKSENLRRK